MGEDNQTIEKQDIFKGVTYYIVGDIGSEVTSLLDQHGAKRDPYLSEMVSHVIANSSSADDYSEAKELFELPIVTSDWVVLSVKCGKQLPKEVFALEGRLFSGVVACPWQLEMEDVLPVWGMVVYHGGRCQLTLDKSVTHLITASLEGAKFEYARDKGVKVVTPDWVSESVGKHERQSEELFHPELVEYPRPEPPQVEMGADEAKCGQSLEQDVDMEVAYVAPATGTLVDNQRPHMFSTGQSTPKQLGEERMEVQRPDTPSAKEALARKISSRIHGKASSEPTTPERPSFPVTHRSLSPASVTMGHSSAGLRFSPLPALRPTAVDPSNIRNTLRNITNRSAAVGPSLPVGNARINQMAGIPHRAPPPDYPYRGHGVGPSQHASGPSIGTALIPGAGASNNSAVPSSTAIAAMPGGTNMAAMPGGTNMAAMPGGTNMAAMPGGTSMAAIPGGTSMAALPGGTNMAAIPGSTSVAAIPGGTNMAAIPGTTNVAAIPGGTNVAAMPGSTNVPTIPGSTNIAAVPGGPSAPQVTAPPLVGSGQSPSGSTYFGHDPKENVHPELCLLGCVFLIVEYQTILGEEEIVAWKKVIEQYGGQLEASYCHRVTHILCSTQKSDICKMALKEGKRVVSAFWLNDCLMQKKMVPPWQALHLPLSFNSEKPGSNQMISVTNFDGEERVRLKQMISAIGAKYTGYMTHHNSALICKKSGGMKFEKAKEWRIAVVNVQWLSDLVLGNMDALRLPVHVRYLQVGQGREFHMDLARVVHLMGGWKTPVRIHKDTWKKFGPMLRSLSGQENIRRHAPSPPKRQKVDTESPLVETNKKPKILFTQYPASVVSQLQNMVRHLGGAVVTNPRHCTHVVCASVARTIKLFVAVNTCRHVVSKDWLEDSFKQAAFIDEAPYAVKEHKSEATRGIKLAESLQRAKTKPLFQGLSFHVTPSVVPPVCELVSIIESAGGSIIRKRPSVKQVLSSLDEQGQPKIITITCPNDLHLCQDLLSKKISTFNAEFVLTGVLRQEIDYNIYKIKA